MLDDAVSRSDEQQGGESSVRNFMNGIDHSGQERKMNVCPGGMSCTFL